MTHASSFVPRELLERPEDFGVESDVTWSLATNLDEAIRLSRAIDQHVQALGVARYLRRGRYSMTDLAKVLGERPETLAAKLRGKWPAPEGDLVLWSWMTGTRRIHRPLAELAAPPGGDAPEALLPDLGVSARMASVVSRRKRVGP